MSNVTITKSSPADYIDNPRNDTRRTNLDSATDYRPVVPVRRDWKSIAAHYAGAAVLLLIVAFLYGIFRLTLCWGSFSETCENWRWIEAWGPIWVLRCVVIALIARGVIWCFQASNGIEQGRIENERFSLLPDRFGNPTPAGLYNGLSPADRFDKYYLLAKMATDLQRDTAKDQWVPSSVNTLTLTGPSYKNDLALPEPIEDSLTLTPDDQWRKWLLKAPHLLIGGKTDAGKTTFQTAILGEYIDNGDQVLILDPHWQPGKWFGLSAVSGVDAILQLLPDLLTELTDRLKEYERGKLTEEFDRLVILIDEVPAIVARCVEPTASGRPKLIDYRWPRFASQLGSEARKVGVRVILGSQSTDVQDLLINRMMRLNYTKIGLGNLARDLLAQEKDTKKKQALYDLLRGQSHPAAMEYHNNFYVLDTSNVVALAERHMRPLARVWDGTTSVRPSGSQGLLGALLNGHVDNRSVSAMHAHVKPTVNAHIQTTDRRQTTDRPWDHAKKIAVLRAMRQASITRNSARDRLARIGQGFDNDDWTEAGL